MSDFNYEIERTDRYFFENFTVNGKSVQDGTPTPDAPVDVEVASLYWNQQFQTVATQTHDGVTTRYDSTTHLISITNNSRTTNYTNGSSRSKMVEHTVTGHKYYIGGDYVLGVGVTSDGSNQGFGQVGTVFTALTSSGFALRIDSRYDFVTAHPVGSTTTLHMFVVDLTEMFGAGNEPTAEQFVAMYPEVYYPYDAGNTQILLKTGTSYTPIDLQGNVLASLPNGTKDVLTVDSAGHCVLSKNVGYVLADGSTKTAYSVSTFTGKQHILIDMGAGSLPSNTSIVYVICDKLPGLTGEQEYLGSTGIANGNNRFLRFCCDEIQSITTTEQANTWLQANPLNVYYELATPQTIDLGTIDVSSLQDIETEIPITLIASLETETEYSYNNKSTYQVENPYENADAPEYAYPPNHFGQKWETFDANDWNVSEMLNYTGQPESHAVYTVELCELMQSGTFDWKRPELDWSEAAYNKEQYEQFCKYFESRFMFREISMLPPLHWFTALKRMMVYELMPKYKPLYAQVANGISPLGENEYYKERHVSSSYPETLLSGNSDYISSGEDREFERIKVDNAAEALETYRNGFRSVDAALGDELEVLFISMYTSFVNAF